MPRISLGGSPLTPRIAVWRRDPEFRLGVFFYFRKTNRVICQRLACDYRNAAGHPYPVAVGRIDPK